MTTREQYWIDIKKSHVPDYGYNLSKSADSRWRGLKLTEEHKKKLSLAHRGKKRMPHSAETKKKMLLSAKGRSSWSKGLTKETDSRVKSPWNKGKTGVYSVETLIQKSKSMQNYMQER